MNDFIGSVAQQDVQISTEVRKASVVGENYYDSILYITDRFLSFGGNTPVYPVVTASTYADVLNDYAYFSADEKTIIKGNLDSFFAYGTDVTVYIIPSSLYDEYKMRGYFCYLDLDWRTADGTTTDYSMDASAGTTLTALAAFDKAFSRPITDFPVDPTKVTGTSTTTTAATLALMTAYNFDLSAFARAAMPSGAVGAKNAYLDADDKIVGWSPALYQLGRTLYIPNESGVPVGNALDMTSMPFQNVLPTADTDIDFLSGASATFANWFESVYLNYFKPVGNATMDVTNFGGWTLRANCIGAEWIVAYENYVDRVACAVIITSGKAFKNQKTYGSLLDAVVINKKAMIAAGRIESFKLTAPSFSELPKTDGHTISIPGAWEGYYVDNVRKVKISGTLTVAA